MADPRDCPCCSGKRYAVCCRPYHQGAEPPDCPALVRSRFAAYALKDIDYLARTLHPEHPDRKRSREELTRELRVICKALKFVRLQILADEPGVDAARVLFLAEIFDSGKERSFVELSSFQRAEGGYRYLSGRTRERKDVGDPAALSIATF